MSEHFPVPGPGYWDFLCERCGEAVDDHPLRLWKAWRRDWWRAMRRQDA